MYNDNSFFGGVVLWFFLRTKKTLHIPSPHQTKLPNILSLPNPNKSPNPPHAPKTEHITYPKTPKGPANESVSTRIAREVSFLPVFCKGVLVLKISHLLKGGFGSDSQAGLAYIKGMTSYLVMWGLCDEPLTTILRSLKKTARIGWVNMMYTLTLPNPCNRSLSLWLTIINPKNPGNFLRYPEDGSLDPILTMGWGRVFRFLGLRSRYIIFKTQVSSFPTFITPPRCRCLSIGGRTCPSATTQVQPMGRLNLGENTIFMRLKAGHEIWPTQLSKTKWFWRNLYH